MTERHDDLTESISSVLVLAATGKTGSRVLTRLRERTDRDLRLRAGSRSAPIPFDWDDPDGWPAVLDGIDAVYLSYVPDLAIPRAEADIRRFVAAAKHAGVRRIVLLSGRGEAAAERCEQIVIASGLEWTVLSCAWFMQNFSEGYLLEPLLAGELAFPAGETPEPFVDVDDIAEVAAAALVDDDHLGRRYEITGPQSITYAEAVRQISAASGRVIEFVPVPAEAYLAEAKLQGLEPEMLDLFSDLFELLDGRNAGTSSDLRQALGREPGDFGSFVARNAEVWRRQDG